MQITANTTELHGELSVQIDEHGRDHCVLVLAGSYRAGAQGRLHPIAQARGLAFADQYYGAPESSVVEQECDFALHKPLTDVIVIGKAVAPGGQPVTELQVSLEIAGRRKQLLVIGERRWIRVGIDLIPSKPVPFVEMPLTFDRAFGGSGDPRNLVGVGAPAVGVALPNIEDPSDRITNPRSRPTPIGVGCIARNAQPRIALAGTYDAKWLEYCCPFLPADFDPRYHQAAPKDQQFPRFSGGERIRCIHMASRPVVEYEIPTRQIPVRFRFVQGLVEREAELDTILLEPHLEQATLIWRASAPLTKKLVDLRAIEAGEQPSVERTGVIGYRRGKPVFPGLTATLRWLRRRRSR